MKIICTVREFGILVRGCAKNGCYNCLMQDVCSQKDTDGEAGIERFITAEDVVEEEDEQ